MRVNYPVPSLGHLPHTRTPGPPLAPALTTQPHVLYTRVCSKQVHAEDSLRGARWAGCLGAFAEGLMERKALPRKGSRAFCASLCPSRVWPQHLWVPRPHSSGLGGHPIWASTARSQGLLERLAWHHSH